MRRVEAMDTERVSERMVLVLMLGLPHECRGRETPTSTEFRSPVEGVSPSELYWAAVGRSEPFASSSLLAHAVLELWAYDVPAGEIKAEAAMALLSGAGE